MEINNLKRAAEISTQITAINDTKTKLKTVFCGSEESSSPEMFDLKEVGTGVNLELTECLVMSEIHHAIEDVLNLKHDELVKEARAL